MIVINKGWYLKINTDLLDLSSDITITTTQLRTFKYRINGGVWTTDTTSGLATLFGVSNGEVYIRLKDNTRITLPSGILEIYSSRISTVNPTNTSNYELLSNYSISEPIQIILHQYIGEKNLVDKNTGGGEYFDSTYEVYGQFTEEIDILNPSILLEWDDMMYCNYCEIPSLLRKYWITKITNVRKNLWRLDCHVDVLYTYNSDIRAQSGLVLRSIIDGNGGDNPLYLVDDRLPLDDIPTIESYEIPFSYDTEYRDNAFDSRPVFSSTTTLDLPTILLSVIETNEQPASSTSMSGSLATGLPDINRDFFRNYLINTYVVDVAKIKPIMDKLKDDDTLATFVANIIAIPFAVPTASESSTLRQIHVGEWNSQTNGILLRSNSSSYMRIARIDMRNYFPNDDGLGGHEFLNFEPYTQLELYIPYYGWTKLSTHEVYNCILDVFYNIDYIAGNSAVTIYNETEQRVIFSAPAHIGVKIAVSTTNQREINTEKGVNALGLTGSLIASAGAIVGGIMTENPLPIIFGAAGGVSAIVSNIGKNAMLFDKANAQFADGNTGLFAPQHVKVKVTYRKILAGYTDTDFYNKNGKPCNFYGSLANCFNHTEVINIEYKPDSQTFITSTEISEIEELAKDGIIL